MVHASGFEFYLCNTRQAEQITQVRVRPGGKMKFLWLSYTNAVNLGRKKIKGDSCMD